MCAMCVARSDVVVRLAGMHMQMGFDVDHPASLG